MSTSQETMSAIAILTSSIAFSKFLVKLRLSGMPTFQHATMRSSGPLPGVEAPACGGVGRCMAPASAGAWQRARRPSCERGGRVGTMKMATDTTFMIQKNTKLKTSRDVVGHEINSRGSDLNDTCTRYDGSDGFRSPNINN